ncbi:(2Fe-2S)-binding protein [Saccharothrix sp. S26]|uniref:2Fe-2S iron-sulfur cluster-binding protein n=1 Tax=Saccharothrix sp. S26 TaxID=2907215 RepID=UPI001F1E04A5|nr:2Fe-2S iron-sulfur cluster-binding protein [Saccharothrix sp. S26]MCE6998312.1 (2Fe-2S)-binding protein [Saccharothrix sp. S26]
MITVTIAGEPFDVPAGTTLQQLDDRHRTALVFGCRAAQCGACVVRILSGAAHLSPPEEDELVVLDVLGVGGDHRLACQCTVFGDISLEVAE